MVNLAEAILFKEDISGDLYEKKEMIKEESEDVLRWYEELKRMKNEEKKLIVTWVNW